MTLRSVLAKVTQQEDLNFLLTNRIPRRAATLFVGWLSQVEHPWVSRACIGLWKLFGDLDLSEAKETRFRSMHACFTRELREGARPVDPDPAVLTSPCDAIVGATGTVADGMVLQAKGFPYSLLDLLADPELVDRYRGGHYVTLRLTAGMYHRFHAPYDCRVEQVTYISGDTWNVNEIALQRVEKLYCKNERAVIELDPSRAQSRICLVPVAAILVASIRLNWLNELLSLKYMGPNKITCKAKFNKGDELGYFQHGSTIILFATPDFNFCDGAQTGERVLMGQPLLSFSRQVQ